MVKSFKWSTQHLLHVSWECQMKNTVAVKEQGEKIPTTNLQQQQQQQHLNEWIKKGDEMKANDNHFLAWIHIHCSNMERESVEISAHQAINMASVSIFFLAFAYIWAFWYSDRLVAVLRAQNDCFHYGCKTVP